MEGRGIAIAVDHLVVWVAQPGRVCARARKAGRKRKVNRRLEQCARAIVGVPTEKVFVKPIGRAGVGVGGVGNVVGAGAALVVEQGAG